MIHATSATMSFALVAEAMPTPHSKRRGALTGSFHPKVLPSRGYSFVTSGRFQMRVADAAVAGGLAQTLRSVNIANAAGAERHARPLGKST